MACTKCCALSFDDYKGRNHRCMNALNAIHCHYHITPLSVKDEIVWHKANAWDDMDCIPYAVWKHSVPPLAYRLCMAV